MSAKPTLGNVVRHSMEPVTHEGCKMVAHWTGDGWHLAVQTQAGEEIAYLEWPEQWPEKMTTQALQLAGFEVQ